MTDDELALTMADVMLDLCCRHGTIKERFLFANEEFDRVLELLRKNERWPDCFLHRAEEIGVELHWQLACIGASLERHEALAMRRLAEKMLILYADVQRAGHNARD